VGLGRRGHGDGRFVISSWSVPQLRSPCRRGGKGGLVRGYRVVQLALDGFELVKGIGLGRERVVGIWDKGGWWLDIV
jgi:hypothetical protein